MKFRAGALSARLWAVLGLSSLLILLAVPVTLTAQTGGEGAITGTVVDTTGAAIPNATVTARNVATGVATTRTASSAGVFQISPLIVGAYSVTVTAAGFQTFQQQGIVLNEFQTFGLNPVMKPGGQSETVTVTTAPPALDTANATLGGTITSEEFAQLPLMVAGQQQRDITSFSNLLPGAQPGARSSLFSGTASRVEEVYLDGIPLTTISQIGDNRPIFNIVPFESIGQVGALTSGQSVEYQGAGSVNYNMKSGGNQYHGTAAIFIRNTAFDTWGFTAATATEKKLIDGVIQTVPVGKPVDHQIEWTAAGGGPISIPGLFSGHDKLFFYAAFDKLHSRAAPAYGTATIPTTLMRTGDFTEISQTLWDPSTLSCTPICSRQPFMGLKNGVPTANVIPANELSPIAQKMQSYLPDPTVPGIANNYLGGNPTGYDNWLYSGRIDYTVSPRQTLSFTVTGGNRHAWPFTSNGALLPLPYTTSDYSTVAGHWADMSDSYTITQNLVNQFKFGFSNFGGPPIKNLTEGTEYAASNMGIGFTGVPSNGQAVTEFPTSTWSGPNAPSQWSDGASGNTATTVSNTYTAVDNLLWVKGKHAMTFGIQYQWLEENADSFDGPVSSLTLNWGINETAEVAYNAANKQYSYPSTSGFSYASYLMGAIAGTGITLQPFSVLGGRYHPIAPYFQDDWKVTPKLTLNLGLRWDYIPAYREVLNRYSFLNPNLTNPVTGNNGALQFAGNYGGSGVSCGCETPAHDYMKNWGPRVGFAYAPNDKTVFRGSFAVVYSHGGGTGGAGGTYAGPSQLGFTSSPSYTDGAAGPGASPAFYLNNSAAFTTLGIANSNFGGPGYSVPPITPPGAISQTLNVGNYLNSGGAYVSPSGAPGYEDPYLAGRAPQFDFWNFGIQRALTNDITIMANYAGSESHFLAGASNMRGLESGQLNPTYWRLGALLNQAATPANVTAAGITLPYAAYGTAAATSAGAGKATIAHALTWMPQFSGTSDTWGSQSANASYHSLQISLQKRTSHGLTLNLNYTYSKNLDDAGTQRSGFPIPASTIKTGQAWAANRIDRSWSTNSVPQNLSIYGVYQLPFGKGAIGGSNFLVRTLAGGWTLSGVFTYISGTPLAITSSSCNSSNQPGAGTCMPDLNPNYASDTVRQNGSWGKGTTATTLGKIYYANGYINNSAPGADASGGPCTSSSSPFCNSQAFMFGDAPRIADYGLRNPSVYNLNASVRRSFNLTPERVKFIFAVDCQNVTNKVTFSGIGVGVNSASFGTVSSATSNSGSRDFQFDGRINF